MSSVDGDLGSAVLPAGTVTFVLSDVEGSTKLWESDPARMEKALARHDLILVQAVRAHAGTLLKHKGEGDSAFAVFARASDAVAAALSAQRAFGAEAWPDGCVIRVRMAVHTGEAELREEDYYGPAVNRTARLRGIAHGGQTVISRATADLVRDRLADGVGLVDLGEHRLRDLDRAEVVFGLVHADLESRFPPLRSLEVLPNNLPEQLTSLVGREREISEIRASMGEARLVTLTGAAGCGKTRLALQAAAESLDEFDNGVWFVDLAPVADAELVIQTVASTLGLQESQAGLSNLEFGASTRPLEDVVYDYLATRRLLLVLDNCEHVVSAAARFVERALRGGAAVRILATSREPLGVAGERTWRVPSLMVPDETYAPVDIAMRFDAFRLFVERARMREPGFAPDETDANAIVEICRRLDGIPLAIELAAARVRVVSCSKIAERLDDRFRFLTGGARSALERHQTLRAAVDWSYNSLTESERVLLARLSVFSGGFTLEAAEEVCSDGALDTAGVFDVLVSLIDKSLVIADRTEGRYGLLETIRQYAREKLLETGDVDSLRARHGAFFGRLVSRSRDERYGSDVRRWFDAFAADHDNLRQALEWAIISQETDAALSLASDLLGYWTVRGFSSEAGAFLERVLELPAGDERLRVRCLTSAAYIARFHFDDQAADALISEALASARRLGDPDLLAGALTAAATCDQLRGNFARGRTFADEAVSVAHSAGSRLSIATASFRAGCVARDQGDADAARAFAREALAVARDLGFTVMIGYALTSQALLVSSLDDDHVGAAALLDEALELHRDAGSRGGSLSEVMLYLGRETLALGDTQRARTLTEEGLQHARDAGSLAFEMLALTYLGNIELAEGNLDDTASRYRQALTIAKTVHAPIHASVALHALGRLAALSGRPDHATQILAFVESSLIDQDDPAHFISPRIAPRHLETVAALREALGEDAFQTAWSAGTALTLDDAIDLALEQR